MARAKKEAALTPEERLQAALVPDWEWPYKLPKNWCWTRIGMVSNFERGITFPAAAKEAAPTEDNIPCLRTANVQENLEIDDMIYVNRDFMKGNIAKLVRENDIIMSSANSRELVGKSSLVTHIPFPMTFGGFVLNIRAKEMSSKYLFYFLRHEFLAGKFIGESSQTTNIANINTTTLGNYEIPLPPLPEQQRIVDRIESLFAKLDEAKEKAQAVVDSFEARKAAILHKAFTGELTAKWREEHGVRMESWEKHLLSTVSSLQTGLMKGKKYTGKTVELPYLRVANVQDGFLRLDEIKKIDVEENAISRYSLAVGDVLFTEGGDFDKLGRGTVWEGQIKNCLHQNHIFVVRPNPEVLNPYFLSYQAGSRYGKAYFLSCSKQTTNLDPKCLNKLGRILNMRLQLSSKYGEYDALMRFLTETGMDFLEMIDLREIHFSNLLESVYKKTNTSYFKDVLQQLRDNYSTGSTRFGRYTIRYLLLNLREDLLERVMPSQFSPQWKCKDLYLSRKCFPFECNPLASDLADSKTSQISQAKYLARVVEKEKTEVAVPYWSIVKSMQDTGEIYCDLGGDLTEQAIQKYNDCLDDWEKRQGYEIISDGNAACIAAYEASTLFILNKLLELSQIHNKGQKEVNEKYLRNCDIAFSDPKKEEALKYAFVNSRVLLVYGAAGTGKTTLIDMIPTMLSGRRKLFLTKTHTALQNLQRRINNPGADASFVSINSFTKRVNLPDYDVIFVDECSTIDNRAMKVFLEKMRPDTFLVLAGDTYQIESIDFGNWFTYAKDIIKTKGSNVELVSTWRTKDPGLIELWNETRNKGALITEKLVIDGPFSENIGEGVLNSEIMDEVILCLNYDGKFGLNNMNSYFQNANTGTAVVWRDWKYKVGDHILFNDTDRFSLLYNNLKGRIVQIELFDSRIRFTVDVEIPLTEQDCQNDGIEFIDIIDDVTRIRFDVLDFEEEMADEDRKKAIVPFQLAYAVSIHKAQGLEYRSVKVVIPSSNAEKITHGIFYTAITRAKEKLKIYWSSETMQEVVAGFSVDTSKQKSLAIIKEKLKQDKNT